MRNDRIARAHRRWVRLFSQQVTLEQGFMWTPWNMHLSPQDAMRRYIGTCSKNRQIRYAEVKRQLRQCEAIIDG